MHIHACKQCIFWFDERMTNLLSVLCVLKEVFLRANGIKKKAYAFKFCTFIGGVQVAVKGLIICMNIIM